MNRRRVRFHNYFRCIYGYDPRHASRLNFRLARRAVDRCPAAPRIDQQFKLLRGEHYTLNLEHLGTNLEDPDIDWTALFECLNGVPAVLVEPVQTSIPGIQRFRGVHDPSTPEDMPPYGPYEWYFPIVDLAIDSDNDNGFNTPTGDEDGIEEQFPGKIVHVSAYDTDADEVPDFADGIGKTSAFGPWGTPTPGAIHMVPVVVTVDVFAEPADTTLTFGYSGADPTKVSRSEHGPMGFTYFVYSRGASGRLRLWQRPGDQERNPSSNIGAGGDYVAPGAPYTLADLDSDARRNRSSVRSTRGSGGARPHEGGRV